jgi:hypothetical protein
MTFKEISSFSFKLYYDERMLEFIDVQKHHPYTEEEAVNLRTTRFSRTTYPYMPPLAYNFTVSAGDKKVDDFFKYFDINNVTYDNANPTSTIPKR